MMELDPSFPPTSISSFQVTPFPLSQLKPGSLCIEVTVETLCLEGHRCS